VIEEVLKQFPSFDAAYTHLSEFNNFGFDSDDDEEMEESKTGSAQA
jgi:hypothetical protein